MPTRRTEEGSPDATAGPVEHVPSAALEESATFDSRVIHYIQRAAATGLYEIRGMGAKRRLPHFDDLVFLGASLSRYPLEGYREKCSSKTTLGTRFAKRPIELALPITIAGMSFGALSANVKEALGRAASEVGTSTTTGDGGMTPEERRSSKTLVYQCLPSRYGFKPDDVRKADAIEIVIGQGAKPGGGGMLLGQKVSSRVAAMRTLPAGIDQRSASRHPDWTGPDDLTIKIQELREISDWQIPIYVKMGATRVFHDVKLAVHAGADVIVVDGMQGGTAATQWAFIEHVGIPTLAAVRQAVEALEEMNKKEEVQLIVSGGIRTGADVAKALALGADAVSIGQGVLIALGCNASSYVQEGRHLSAVADYHELGTAPGVCHHCHTGRCPVGVTTQDPVLEQRLTPEVGARRVRNYLRTLNLELTMIARACGKQDVHHLEREDLVALTIEAAAMANVPLAGTSWIPGVASRTPA
jgi:methylamine---glutamate N-methyltransferase subunit C